jgi:RNA polymerase sigma-70 factor, ECF subfamily
VQGEQEIITAVLAGDAEAFASLVRAYQARIRLVCLVYLGSKEEADDAAQDVFLKAFEGLPGFKGESSFQTWLLRIADNHCRDLLRSRKRQQAQSLDALLGEKGDALEAMLSRREASGQADYTTQELELMARLFSALPPADREILALKEAEMLSYEEIAHKLRCSLDAVKGRLKRARATLLEKCRNFLDTSASR